MTVMTKTAARAVNRQIRALQRERRDWLSGTPGWWGVPWCAGPGSRGHQQPSCEGCCTRLWCADRAGEIAGRIRRLQAQLVPAGQSVQEALW